MGGAVFNPHPMKMPEWRDEVKQRLATLKLEPVREAEIVEELSRHLDDCYAESLARGATPEAAHHAALAELSEDETLRRELSRVERRAAPEPIVLGTNRRRNMIADIWQDLRYGARMLVKSKGMTIIALLSLAAGIGANIVIFSIVNSILLRPRPVAQPDRLVELYTSDHESLYNYTSYPSYLDFRERNEVFTGLAAYRGTLFKMGSGEQVEEVLGETVSGNYFDVLGVRPFKGRAFLPEEDRTPGSHPVAVISHSLWLRRFNADPDVIGKTITLDNVTLTIIGVAPQEYTGMGRGLAIDVWAPAMMAPQLAPEVGMPKLTSRGDRWVTLIGRLKPGVTLEQARARFDLLTRELREAHPEEWRQRRGDTGETYELSVTILPESETRIHPGDEARTAVYALIALLMAIVNLVLLIACMNLANLLLARAVARRKEIAVRLALGASRFRLIRQLLAESALLALIAGAAGMAIGLWLLDLFIAFMPPLLGAVRLALDVRLDWHVLLYALVFSTLTGMLFGLAPALQASKADVVKALKDEASLFAGGYRQSRLRNGLVVAQVTFSMLLLIGAGLTLRSLEKLRPTRMGFESENMLVATLELNERQYDPQRSQGFYLRLSERISALPGAQAVTSASVIGGFSGRRIGVEGYQPGPNEDMQIRSNTVGPRYFTTMKIPFVEGRDFDERDREGAPCVAIVNEAFARRYFAPEGRALGGRLINRWRDPVQRCEIVGVVRDDKLQSLREEPLPAYAFPFLQFHERRISMLVSATGDPGSLTLTVRRAIQSLDPNISIIGVKTVSEHFNTMLFPLRVFGLLIGACGALVLLLAAIGVYGVVSYSAAQRTREIGVRVALGAMERDILKLVVGQGMKLVMYGLGVGLALSLALMRLLTSSLFRIDLLFGVNATDALTFIGVTTLLAGVALAACYLPARRATKADPMVALRSE
jgi:macrolide transport system ATP-binding/permease protein